MFDSSSFTQDMLSNPTKLANVVIDAMEASDTAETVSINDPNNGFVMQLFSSVAIFSKFSEKIDYINNFYYSKRARNAEQLYPHISEFSYVKLMASPATLPFVFAMSKDWIIANAVYFDSNYNKIQIPATSYITMGGIVYSMYYPIDIFVNRNTNVVTAFYNFDEENTLKSLDSNMLNEVVEYTQNGINYFQITFDMFQFERKITQYTVGSEQGFSKTISFDDKFYAVKIYTLNPDKTWSELAYSLTQMYYDYTTPTALLTLMSDSSQLKIEIPQVYFTNNQISQTIKIEMYTTKGAVDYSVSLSDVTDRKANFDTTSSLFAAPLDKMPTLTLVPTTVEVVGGSDPMSYTEMRDAIVNQRLYDNVAITPQELIEAFRKAGFTPNRVIDDLTDRMYYASNTLTDSKGMIIPTFVGSILIEGSSLEGDPSSIIKHSDGYYTILPTTTFTIENDFNVCVPMNDSAIDTLQSLPVEDYITELNTGKYIRQFFHITLLTTPKSPAVNVYNLLSPTVRSLKFIGENPNSIPQMSATSCGVIHQNSGTGGYRIRLSVTRSTNIKDANIGDFSLILTCATKTGESVYIPATFVGTDAYNSDIWEVILSTNYHITTDNHITVMMYDSSDILQPVQISLEQTFTILTSFLTSTNASIPKDSDLNNSLPSSLETLLTCMAKQEMSIIFGDNLSEQIYSGVNTTWGNDVYDTADETIYYSTNVPIFQKDENDIIVTRLNTTTSTREVVVLYDIGDTPSAEGDFTALTTSSGGVSASNGILEIDDSTGILVGMNIRGFNIPTNATVESIVDKTITISPPFETVVPEGTEVTFTNPTILTRTTSVQTAAGTLLTIADTSSLLVGMSVYGFDIPEGSVIESIVDGTTFTIDKPTLVPVENNTLLSILNTTTYGVIKTLKGEILTDGTGAPIVVKAGENVYRIPAILFDGRLFASTNPSDVNIVETISQRLQNYANQISTIDAGLTENSDVFYKPARTMGTAVFGIGNNETITLPLSMSFQVTVYVDEAVYNTSDAQGPMKQTIYSIINDRIQQDTISISETATLIKDSLGSSVSGVEMGGINGDPTLRHIALKEYGMTPSIEYILNLQSDGSITRDPNITIEFKPKPETVDTVIINTL